MTNEIFLFSDFVSAFISFIGFLTCMCYCMDNKMTLLSELFTTVCAFVRFLSRVSSLMNNEICHRTVAFPTFIALIRCLICMCSLMINIRPLINDASSAFNAHWALVTFFVYMYSMVPNEISFVAEDFPTFRAIIRFLTCVFSHAQKWMSCPWSFSVTECNDDVYLQ